MLRPGTSIQFRSCTVTVHADFIETRFNEDGSVSRFVPPLDEPDFQAAARYAGYGDDPWRHAVEHDIAHAWLADALGWPHSWSVWSSAHGTAHRPGRSWSQRVADEEHLVVSLQRYVNTGLKDDEHGVLDGRFGAQLPSVASSLMEAMRPWLVTGARRQWFA